MNTLVVLTVVDIVLLIAGLAIYLYIVGGQLTRVAGKLEECSDIVCTCISSAVNSRGSQENSKNAQILFGKSRAMQM